jgi:hypothetical protein
MDGFLPTDSDHIPPPLPGTVTVALDHNDPFSRSNCFIPPGTLGGLGRSPATRSPPDRLGPTRSTSGPLGSGQLGSVFRAHPCSAQATRIPAEHTARADSDPSVQSVRNTIHAFSHELCCPGLHFLGWMCLVRKKTLGQIASSPMVQLKHAEGP